MSKKIYVGLSNPKSDNIYSKGIRTILRTPYSHCYVRWETSWGFDAVYEASGSSIKFVGGDIWHKNNNIHREWEMDISSRTYHSKFLPYLMSISGTSYGFIQILGILIAIIFGLSSNPLGDKSRKMICSELVYYILTEIFEKKWENDPDLITPKDLERFMDEST